MLRMTFALLVLSCVVVQMDPLYSQDCCPTCGSDCDASCLVQKTIKVPTLVTVLRMQSCIVNKTVEREETYTVFRQTPVKKKYYKEYCYLDDEVKTKTIENKKCQIVKNRVVTDYKVNIPVEEYHYRDPGCCNPSCCPDCESGRCNSDCGPDCGSGCRNSGCCQNDSCCHKQGAASCPSDEGCVCKVTRMTTGMRTSDCERPAIVFLTEKREIDYCVKVPKKHKEFCREETVYKLEPVEKTRTVSVCVPEYVKKPVEVQVCKMLSKTIWCCEKCCERY